MAITTTTVMPAPVAQSFNYKLLSVPTPYFIHKIPAMAMKMPANGGRILRSRRYDPLPTATVPLGNSGLTPPAVTGSFVDIDAEVSFYGQYMLINEQVTLQSQDPVLNAFTQRLGISLRQTEDELTREMLKSTASQINCVSGTNGDSPTEITRDDVNDVVRSLKNANAYTLADNVEGDDKFGTAPLRNSYLALCSTQLVSDLENIAGYIPVAQYPQPDKALRPEEGSASNLRFLTSSIGAVEANASLLSRDVYDIFCVGLEAYACVEQDQYSAKFIYLPPEYSGPLAQNASIGWKFAEVPIITNDAWIVNLRASLRV